MKYNYCHTKVTLYIIDKIDLWGDWRHAKFIGYHHSEKVCYSVALPYRAYTTELRTRETLNTNDAPKMLVYYAAMM